MSEPPTNEQDFIKGWPSPSLLEQPSLVAALSQSHAEALKYIGSCLNYGTLAEGAHMRGHPAFLNALAVCLRAEARCSKSSYVVFRNSSASGTVQMWTPDGWSPRGAAPWAPTSAHGYTQRCDPIQKK